MDEVQANSTGLRKTAKEVSEIVRFVTCLENSWCHGDLQ